MIYIFGLIIAYFLGSIPMGLLLTKFAGRGDLRKVGSGNIGATNVMRVGGLRLAGLVWLLDMAKAVLAVFICGWLGDETFAAWGGFAAVIGHCFPVWLGFRGGKGVSCLFGVLLAVNPLLFLICGLEWLLVALTSGYSSLGAVVVFCLVPVFGFFVSAGTGWAFLAIALICLLRHHENIARLVGGTESKVVWKWKK
ncbi:MAG: glycerol-3-phosphate 1-O-acyltransferase PlsY [Alphaproteobacteria bacterium]|nr:glycerol-3-phosphate 1-O-acyltransferase PlsY [Alphaproteobacteria bacterium]